MKKFLDTIIDSVHYLLYGGDEKEHNAIPLKEKYQVVIVWAIIVAFCIIMLLFIL
jgi:hypothetical protein